MKLGLSGFGRLVRFKKSGMPHIHAVAIPEEEIETLNKMYEELDNEKAESAPVEQQVGLAK